MIMRRRCETVSHLRRSLSFYIVLCHSCGLLRSPCSGLGSPRRYAACLILKRLHGYYRGLQHPGLLSSSEEIAEAEIEIDGIEVESHGLERGFEYIVAAPGEIGVDKQVLVGSPCDATLHTPLEMAQIIAEVI